MFFRIYGCLVAHGKCIFRKCISVILCWECKLIFVSILPSNTIFWKTQRERAEWEGERKKSRAQRERGRERERTILRRRAVDLAVAMLPSCLRAVDRDLAKHRADRDREAPHCAFAPFSLPSSLNLTGFDDFFFLWVLSMFLYWGMNDIVIFVWQLRKCEKMWITSRKCVFYGIFQEHNQTPENIFRKIFWNATKHMKTFSFLENSISKKWNIFRKCFYTNQTQLE